MGQAEEKEKKSSSAGRPQPEFLPMSMREAKKLGITQFDVVLVSGDAYVDHPSFGTALIGRVLWDAGYTVGVIAQPDWHSPDDLLALGRPRLFFSISSGSVDSMVNHYTPNKKRRSEDVYSPGGRPNRPDRATIVYAQQVHALFPETPLLLGGIEASLRRFAHYDYWSDSVRQSILADAPADQVVYGMGEQQIVAIADRLNAGESIGEIMDVAGTAVKMAPKTWRAADPKDAVVIPSYTEVAADKRAYAEAFRLHALEQNPIAGRRVVQPHPKTVIIQNPPALPLSTGALDQIYALPFTRKAHPRYTAKIPALEPVRFSVTSHRGCFGSCSFCALTHHQGRIIQSRSVGSIVDEVTRMTGMKGWKGIVQDVGGPSANMYGLSCPRWQTLGPCADKTCSPDCPSLTVSHQQQVEMLGAVRAVPGVRKAFISSGVRYDLVLADHSTYLQDLVKHHVSGHLKIAPEHFVDSVTARMHKPGRAVFERFQHAYDKAVREAGVRQYLLPYLMSGHPGCTLRDMVELARYIEDHHLYTEQVQDFTPTPMSVSTCMYATGLDPFTTEPVHVPVGREKQVQRALLRYRDPANETLVREGLALAKREDLIGSGPKCLIPDRRPGTMTGIRRP
jgi:uncharacterized radical SAM protein YgiQ